MMQLQPNISTIPGKTLTNMPTIVVTREDIMVKELELNQGELVIGRDDDCGLTLNDSSISSHHAKIITLFNATYIEDMGSTNGTFVNGKQIREHTLHDGDVVTVGKRYRMLFEKNTDQVMKGDKTAVLDRNEMNKALAEFMEQEKQRQQAVQGPEKATTDTATATVSHIQSAAAAKPVTEPEPAISINACLRIMAGEHSGREMPLNRRSTRLSRGGITHASVKRRDQGFFLQRDPKAPADSNILLNDQPLGMEAVLLKPQDIISLNGILMAYEAS